MLICVSLVYWRLTRIIYPLQLDVIQEVFVVANASNQFWNESFEIGRIFISTALSE
jgi:hypothetical protein